ncbi:MAG: trigger factor [Lachnospiraceae bacterium]|nr:trigger factor [Lachnospiraceae bacterium]MBR3484351.1 trigger factor [Lachnospiraceae bacterium]MBR3581082.1 trigger factor [Lachnospiraceae bacterium]MBR4541867.1 trigger factor [Lachnospiraceae bacterium]
MNVKTEDLGKNSFKLTIEVEAEKFTDAYNQAYQKNKNKIQLQGFRKGKAPLALIEKVYGPSVFYEDAADIAINDTYADAAEQSGLEIVSRPEIDLVKIEKGSEFIYTAVVAVKPEVKLGTYKGVEVEKHEAEVTDAEVDAEIEKYRDQNARSITIEDQPVQDKDIIKLDYEGSVDGVPFEGGKAENAELVIGSHTFIDNFEEQLIGMNIGDEKEINVTFPEQYHAENLKGKAAVFKCKINAITRKELPEADDEFAQEISEFDTLAEFKEDIKKKLLESKEKELKQAKEDEVLAKVIETSEMDIPDAMVENEARQMVEDFAQRLQYQGMPFEQYLKYSGMTAQQFVDQTKPQALKRVQARLVLEAIVDAEKIETSDEEVDQEFTTMAEQYKMEKDKIRELIVGKELENMKRNIAVGKAADLIREAAVEK